MGTAGVLGAGGVPATHARARRSVLNKRGGAGLPGTSPLETVSHVFLRKSGKTRAAVAAGAEARVAGGAAPAEVWVRPELALELGEEGETYFHAGRATARQRVPGVATAAGVTRRNRTVPERRRARLSRAAREALEAPRGRGADEAWVKVPAAVPGGGEGEGRLTRRERRLAEREDEHLRAADDASACAEAAAAEAAIRRNAKEASGCSIFREEQRKAWRERGRARTNTRISARKIKALNAVVAGLR